MSTTETETNTKTMAATTSAAAPRPVRASEAEQKLLPTATQHVPNGQLPNTPLAVSVISALLGGLLFSSLAYLSVPYLIALGAGEWVWVRPQLALYGMAMAVFHLSEFWTTAGWNPKKLSIDGECGGEGWRDKNGQGDQGGRTGGGGGLGRLVGEGRERAGGSWACTLGREGLRELSACGESEGFTGRPTARQRTWWETGARGLRRVKNEMRRASMRGHRNVND